MIGETGCKWSMHHDIVHEDEVRVCKQKVYQKYNKRVRQTVWGMMNINSCKTGNYIFLT